MVNSRIYPRLSNMSGLIPFNHPSAILIAGPSFSGKTEFTKKLVTNRDEMFSVKPERVIWCYSHNQAAYRDLPSDVELCEGLFDLDSLDFSLPTLVIYDDMADSDEAQKHIAKVFTMKCHHNNVTACFLTQNIMPPNKYGRTISINAGYFVLMKSPRDKLQVNCLARQIYPKRSAYFLEAYSDATSTPHGYLLVDFCQQTDERYRLRTNIFPGNQTIVYVAKSILQ